MGEGDFYLDINFPFLEQKHNLTIKVFEDYPVHKYGVFDTVPLPTNMLTIYACFSQEQLVENITGNTKKYFDGYSHLGFFLADLPAMEEIIFKKYGTISLDLVDLFTNTTLIDELFQAKIIMIVWGINPYTYPLYSTSDVQSIKLLLGTEHEKYGIYNIRKDLKTLTLISGHKLREWPNFLKESWPSIPLYGLGEKTLLTPFLLKDKGDNETVIASFLIQRCEGSSLETVPLTNLDLLYK